MPQPSKTHQRRICCSTKPLAKKNQSCSESVWKNLVLHSHVFQKQINYWESEVGILKQRDFLSTNDKALAHVVRLNDQVAREYGLLSKPCDSK